MKRGKYILPGFLLLLSSCFVFNKTNKVNKEYTTDSGLKYVITRAGEGKKAEAGKSVKVHYTGKLTDGTEFDSSVKRKKPFVFKLGTGQVIKGWDEGIALLNAGSKATFTIPPELGYGKNAQGSIPANATLIFDVELLEVIAPPEPFNVQGLDTISMESGLKYIKVKTLEKGTEAEAYRSVSVHYTGYLLDDSIFDSSVERGEPITFKLAVGQVIQDWDEGISYLKVDEKARFIITP